MSFPIKIGGDAGGENPPPCPDDDVMAYSYLVNRKYTRFDPVYDIWRQQI
jgi:hypothetical protein